MSGGGGAVSDRRRKWLFLPCTLVRSPPLHLLLRGCTKSANCTHLHTCVLTSPSRLHFVYTVHIHTCAPISPWRLHFVQIVQTCAHLHPSPLRARLHFAHPPSRLRFVQIVHNCAHLHCVSYTLPPLHTCTPTSPPPSRLQ